MTGSAPDEGGGYVRGTRSHLESVEEEHTAGPGLGSQCVVFREHPLSKPAGGGGRALSLA